MLLIPRLPLLVGEDVVVGDGGDHHLDADQQVLDLDGRALVHQVEATHRLPSSKSKHIMSCHIMSFYYSDMYI